MNTRARFSVIKAARTNARAYVLSFITKIFVKQKPDPEVLSETVLLPPGLLKMASSEQRPPLTSDLRPDWKKRLNAALGKLNLEFLERWFQHKQMQQVTKN